MKILIINNETKHLGELQELLKKHEVSVVEFSALQNTDPDYFNAIVLSGGSMFPVLGNEEKLLRETNLVLNTPKPIFGICFGFELIAHLFGAELEAMSAKENGILEINVTEPSDLFLDIKNFQVYEAHRFVVKELPNSLVSLAESKDGIEAFRHKEKEIYAVQFHPEMFPDKTAGKDIFENFLKLVEEK
ncbi:MAG: gamma-glutamyl-gamma-aminobutyrate hydrolase family protein [Candidatus Pacebacteria bacterium]|nr:gamma-glutamyl-gamma-aminobutyrate hydrolase family protein [Candidatus Paceibacterota bacterium]MBP9851592.1 gamma-glutamyl-gamma-aminobutyrate hydrolase family protein [Candidatus Paceibacterota bacterium]